MYNVSYTYSLYTGRQMTPQTFQQLKILVHLNYSVFPNGLHSLKPITQVTGSICHSCNRRQNTLFFVYLFKVCKSLHLRTIQINHQPDATIFQFIILTFIYSSACFGHFPTHHQELNDCSGSLWFYLRIVVIVMLLFAVGPT